MKYINIQNEESAFNVISTNNIIEANITDIHIELTFEDNSMLIYSSVDCYYEMITDPDIFTVIDNDVNIPELIKNYGTLVDTVDPGTSYNGADILMIHEINYKGYVLYYVIRTGINEII